MTGRAFVLAVAALAVAAELQAVKRRAFVTSVSGPGDLGSWPDAGIATGLAAGDTICRARAQAAGLPNAATYRVWLSTPTTDAYCHVQGLTGTKSSGCGGGSLPGGGPWYLVNGISTFTATLDAITGEPWEIYRPVIFDENGDPLPTADAEYWTGTLQGGNVASGDATCSSWLSQIGTAQGQTGNGVATARHWTSYFSRDCDEDRRLLCLEPGTSEVTSLGWSPGSLVFVTSSVGPGDLSAWPEADGANGLAAGDAICQNLAAAASLPAPESFVAWLSTGEIDAADRLTGEGPYRRVDAYAIATSKAGLLDGAIDTSLSVHEDGRYLDSPRLLAWTGTTPDGTAVGDRHCLDWTDGSSVEFGASGWANIARVGWWSQANNFFCSNTNRLYCFSNVVTLFWDGFELTGDTSRWSAVAP